MERRTNLPVIRAVQHRATTDASDLRGRGVTGSPNLQFSVQARPVGWSRPRGLVDPSAVEDLLIRQRALRMMAEAQWRPNLLRCLPLGRDVELAGAQPRHVGEPVLASLRGEGEGALRTRRYGLHAGRIARADQSGRARRHGAAVVVDDKALWGLSQSSAVLLRGVQARLAALSSVAPSAIAGPPAPPPATKKKKAGSRSDPAYLAKHRD
jgi:hypothetical protein